MARLKDGERLSISALRRFTDDVEEEEEEEEDVDSPARGFVPSGANDGAELFSAIDVLRFSADGRAEPTLCVSVMGNLRVEKVPVPAPP